HSPTLFPYTTLFRSIHACLSFVDLDKEAKKSVRKYSGGMKRRLSLAISLIHQPQLIFLDEPTVGVDPALKRTFWDEFDHLRNQGDRKSTRLNSSHVS